LTSGGFRIISDTLVILVLLYMHLYCVQVQ